MPKTIALVENMDYFELSHSIGIDALINKKLLAANSIFRYRNAWWKWFYVIRAIKFFRI